MEALTLASVDQKIFQSPTFESIRVYGSHEKITPPSERSQVERTLKRFGRLVWAEVQLNLTLGTKLHFTAMPIDSIRTANLIEDLGAVKTGLAFERSVCHLGAKIEHRAVAEGTHLNPF